MIITAQLPVASKCECAVQRTELSLTGLSGVGAVQPAFEWHRSALPIGCAPLVGRASPCGGAAQHPSVSSIKQNLEP